MMIPEYIRFYGNTPLQVLEMYAVTFFSMVNSMYRLQARELLALMATNNAAYAGGSEAQSVVDNLKKQERGIHGILQEVRVIKK